MPEPTKRLYTLAEASAYLGMSEGALRHKAHQGKIPIVALDNRLRFDVQDLDKAIEDNKRAA